MLTRSRSKVAADNNRQAVKRRRINETEPSDEQLLFFECDKTNREQLRITQVEYYKQLALKQELTNQKTKHEDRVVKLNKLLRKNKLDIEKLERDLEVLQHVLLQPQPEPQHQSESSDDTYSYESESSESSTNNDSDEETVSD